MGSTFVPSLLSIWLVSLENIEEGVTVANQIDEITGVSTQVVIDAQQRNKLLPLKECVR